MAATVGLEAQGSEVEETEPLILGEDAERVSPIVRRSERKKLLRGRLARARPKSPMMRMAEMRKGSLRGRVLRQSGLKGLEGSELKALKGMKGLAGKGFMRMSSIPECSEAVGVSLEVLGGERIDEGAGGFARGDEIVMTEEVESSPVDEVFGVLPQKAGGEDELLMTSKEDRDVCEGDKGALSLTTTESLVALSEMDRALDLCEAQPLQNMTFLLPK